MNQSIRTTILIISLVLILLLSSMFPGCLNRRRDDDPHTEIRSIIYDDYNRSYRVFIPGTYNQYLKNALVFILHGGGGSAENTENQLTQQGFNRIAEENNIIVVYPDGIEKKWNDGRTEISENESYYDVDDVGFLNLLIDELTDEFNIQDNNVFFTGLSNGGFMCYRMGFENPENIKAIAPVCATNAVDLLANYSANGPVSIAIMCGTADPLVPYEGGYITVFNHTRSKITSVNDTVDYWVGLNQCDHDVEVYKYPDISPDDGTHVIRQSYHGGINGTVVYLYTIHGGGHTWPGGYQYFPEWLIGKTCRDIDANEVIWEFFDEQRRQENDIRTAFVNPMSTDDNITSLSDLPDAENRNLFHFVAAPQMDNSIQLLYVNLPGSGGLPEQYQIISKHAATLGYHVINLAYPNWPAVRTLIQDQSDIDLPEKIRRERIYGEDQTALIQVTPHDSIENRIVKLLSYNHLHHPEEQWNQFLNSDNTLRWDKIVVGGHSQGAGHAAYLAKQHVLKGIIMFAGPGDHVKDYGSAPWIYQENMISAEHMFGFTHRLDPVSRLFFNHQAILGMEEFGSAQRVDGKTIDELDAHILTSYKLNVLERNYHNAVVVDEYIPYDADGITFIYEDVWTYMFSNL